MSADPALVGFAGALADAARAAVLRHFRRPVTVEHKADTSPVTIADREAEQAMRALIGAHYPDHGIRGEEFGPVAGAGRYTWVVDPIDGTKSFITGKPLFGTLIALLENGRPVLGVIDMPVLGERWLGQAGQATLAAGGTPCRTSGARELAQATLYATSPDMFEPADRRRFDALGAELRFRCFGADCYGYALLASGFTELVVEADMQPYDYLALVPVIEGAGGVITDWSGAALGLESDGRVLAAASPALHSAALAFLAG